MSSLTMFGQNNNRKFLVEGKKWDYVYYHLENDGAHEDSYSYVVIGDTIVGNTTYKKIYYKDADLKRLSFLLREDNCKIFKLYLDESNDFLLFDFSRHDIGTVVNLKSEYTEKYVNWMINKIDSVLVGENLFRRFCCLQKYSDLPLSRIEDGKDVKHDFWVEGIGSASSGIEGHSLEIPARLPGAYSYFISCYENGSCIFTLEDFTKSSYITSVQTIIGNNYARKENELFPIHTGKTVNLNGNVSLSKPFSNIIIHNGKKYLVR